MSIVLTTDRLFDTIVVPLSHSPRHALITGNPFFTVGR